MRTALAQPTVADYERQIIEVEGPFTVNGTYYGTGDDADVQRKRFAIRCVARDARRAARMEAATYLVAS